MGISAQSIGGGGGKAKAAGAVSGSLKSLSLAIGGSGGAVGNGGDVSVTTGDGGSRVSTTGKHGIALSAQSVGGGGGIAHSMTDDQTFDPAKILDNPQGRLADVHGFGLGIGGRDGASGQGGAVTVTTSGAVTTSGLGAHAILAQSVGGGGGLALGGQLKIDLPGAEVGGAIGAGDGGVASVVLNAGTSIRTAGDGAYGILAQSVGGGGGIAGDTSSIMRADGNAALLFRAGAGNGGAVSVGLTAAQLNTSGRFAHGIFAQSVAGGGGLYVSDGVMAHGTAAAGTGTGTAGQVAVTLVNSQVAATGFGAAGIMAQSTGPGSSPILITIDARSSVVGGTIDPNAGNRRFVDDVADIRLHQGMNNVIENAGTIGGTAPGNSGYSIIMITSGGVNSVNNSGRIVGIIDQLQSTINVNNRAGGVIESRTVGLGGGLFVNDGTLHVGGVGTIGGSMVDGRLVQSPTGTLVIDADLAASRTDLLTVSGTATIAGSVRVQTSTVSNRPVTVLNALGGLTLDPAASATAPAGQFGYQLNRSGNLLQLAARASFGANAVALGQNRRQVAGHLQSLFDSGAAFDSGFSALARIREPDAYASALDALSGQGLGAVSALRFELSHGFADQMLTGCPEAGRLDDIGPACGWARMQASSSRQDSTDDGLGFRAETALLQLGRQWSAGGDWSVAASLAYAFDQMDGDRAASPVRLSGDSISMGAFVRYHPGRLRLTLAAEGGYGWYESRRFVTAGTISGLATARPAAWHLGLHGEARLHAGTGPVTVEPFARAQLVQVESRAFTEAGLPTFALAVDRERNLTLAASVGMEIAGRMPLAGGGTLRPFARAAYARLAGNNWDLTARFVDQPAGTPAFTVRTPAPDDLGRFAVGIDLAGARNIDLSLQYAPDIGHGYQRHAAVARLSARF